jgi:hypothetical protein
MRLVFFRSWPANQSVPVVATHKHIVGNVEVLRSGVFSGDTDAYVFHPAIPNH